MDIVVTGGSGFVGRVLIQKLLTRFKNSKIINLYRNPHKLPNKNYSTIQTVSQLQHGLMKVMRTIQ